MAASLNSTREDEILAWVERERGASLRAFMLEFRKQMRQPMDEWGWRLVELAHSHGWHDGLVLGLRTEDPEPLGPTTSTDGEET